MNQLEPDFFRSLERKRTQALVSADIGLARTMHAPDYQLVTPGGTTFTLDAYLDAISTGTLRYSKWDVGPMEVRQSPKMAIVRYKARLEFPSGNVIFCWHTDSYERADGGWKAIWSQATEIKRPAVAIEP